MSFVFRFLCRKRLIWCRRKVAENRVKLISPTGVIQTCLSASNFTEYNPPGREKIIVYLKHFNVKDKKNAGLVLKTRMYATLVFRMGQGLNLKGNKLAID